MDAGDEIGVGREPRGGVELGYAPAERRGRRVRRAVRRWLWVIAVMILVAVWWPNRHEVWRKGLVLWWQRQLAGVQVEAGRVVYEPEASRASKLMASSSEYSADGAGKAMWDPRAWRGFPWADVPGAYELVAGWTRGSALVFAGYLKDASGGWKLAVAQLRDMSFSNRQVAVVFVYLVDPETLWRRGWVSGRTMIWLGEPFGRHRIFGGRVAADNPSSFEFEYEEGGVRWVVRATLATHDEIAQTERRKE